MICTYCGREIKDLTNLKTIEYEEEKVLVCSDKCANKFRSYKKLNEKNRVKFLSLTILNSIISIILYGLGFLLNDILYVVATFYLFESIGIISIKHTHVSINKVKNYGITKGTSMVKRRGIILLIIGFIASIAVFFLIREVKLLAL